LHLAEEKKNMLSLRLLVIQQAEEIKFFNFPRNPARYVP
jgi:hypothetical protein